MRLFANYRGYAECYMSTASPTAFARDAGAAGKPHALLASLLRKRHPIGEEECAALAILPLHVEALLPGSLAVIEGDPVTHCSVLLSGYACRLKTTMNGERQILSLHVPGDFVDLQHLLIDTADHSIEMMTPARLLRIPKAPMLALIEQSPAIGLALWRLTLVEGSRFREWITNIGRRDAQARIAHLFCEFAARSSDRPLPHFPLTQVQLADATGLTPGHVNRVLRHFTTIGAIGANKRPIEIVDIDKLITIAGFETSYLH